MSFKGTYRDGIVYLTGNGSEVARRDGERVEVTPLRRPRKSAGPARARPASKTKKRLTKAQRLAAFDAAFGIWKDRPDWKGKTTLEIVAELRKKAMGRNARG
ncbi:hypothetical protein PHYC_02659 [Phycisphaerales bacterium]|nr:hypothetical protein PHYC_02659 [Phycisphaerales bacterium]